MSKPSLSVFCRMGWEHDLLDSVWRASGARRAACAGARLRAWADNGAHVSAETFRALADHALDEFFCHVDPAEARPTVRVTRLSESPAATVRVSARKPFRPLKPVRAAARAAVRASIRVVILVDVRVAMRASGPGSGRGLSESTWTDPRFPWPPPAPKLRRYPSCCLVAVSTFNPWTLEGQG